MAPTFGLPSSRGANGNNNRFPNSRWPRKVAPNSSLLPTESTSADSKFDAIALSNSIDEKMGFKKFEAGPKKMGWLINMHTVNFPLTLDDVGTN
jgi:DNA polymerase epsilon subunit 1